jgi:O-antigen ligase
MILHRILYARYFREDGYQPRPPMSGDQRLFIAYLAFLVWLPLPLGSNRAWSWNLMAVLAVLLFLWWGVLWARRQVSTVTLRRAAPALWLFGVWLLWVLLQLAPLPAGFVQWISPQGFHLHELGNLGEPPATMTLSVDGHATGDFFLRSVAYFILFLLTLSLVDRSTRILLLLRVAVLCGVFQAVYGGVVAMSDLQNASGTFVNRNHFAGFLEITLALGTGLLMSDLGRGEGGSWRQRTRAVVRWLVSPKMSLRILLAIMVIGLVLSRSRMGNSAFFSSLLVAGGIWLIFARTGSRKLGLFILVSILAIDVYILGHWFGFDKVVKRIQETTLETEMRDEVSFESLDYWKDYVWSGSGGGTFYSIFPKYRGTDWGEGTLLHAHNDYLEIMTDTGILGLILLGALVVTSFTKAFQAIRERHRHLLKGLGFGVVMGIVALMIHSTVDFNLQIPAVTAWFVVLLALGWVAADVELPRDEGEHSRRHRHRSQRDSRR